MERVERRVKNHYEMNPEIYFNFMRETTKETESFTLTELSRIRDEDTGLYNLVAANIKKRIETGRPKIRPGLCRLGYEICDGEDWRKIIPVLSAVEVLNVSTYTINRIFDKKGGNWDTEKINNNIIAGVKQREFAHRLLDSSYNIISPREFRDISNLFLEINDLTYSGQFIDLNELNIKVGIPPFEEYMTKYEKRSLYFGGNFYRNSLIIGGLFAEGDSKKIDALGMFGEYLGTGLQMVNDIGDFVPMDQKPYDEAFKYYQDQFGDLRLGKLTLPIYLMIKRSKPEEKEFILREVGTNHTDINKSYSLVRLLFETGAFYDCKSLANQYVRKAKKELSSFEDSATKSLLSASTSAIKSSIYWKKLKRIGEENVSR